MKRSILHCLSGVVACWMAGNAACAQVPERNEYGKELDLIVKDMGISSAMDVAIEGKYAYIIGMQSLFVADISSPGNPVIKGKAADLGTVRQVVVKNGVAYVSSRSHGLYILDVSSPEAPKVICHYDTMELATGLAIDSNILFVACRNFGVQLIDVSDPAKPVHLSIVRTGEAQSVYVRDGYLYTGVWGESLLVVTDVRNPREPVTVSKSKLDGFGDGVYVDGNYAYVSTGHHSAELPRGKPGDPGFGKGHGLELFDISNPAAPVFISRIKFPVLYSLGEDMWGVTVSGKYAFCADTINGVFVVDISNPQDLKITAHRELEYIEKREKHDAVAGLDVADGYIYAAGVFSGLQIIAAPMARKAAPYTGTAIPVTAEKPLGEGGECRVYNPGGQIYSAACVDDVVLVAAGSEGIRVIRLDPEIKEIAQYPTSGFAFYVSVFKDMVFTAEGSGGLGIWKYGGDGKLMPIGRYAVPRSTVKQVLVPPPGKYALLHLDAECLEILDISEPARPLNVLRDKKLGLLYGEQIGIGLLDDRYACAFWHVSGTHWYDLYGKDKPYYTGDNFKERLTSRSGLFSIGSRMIQSMPGGYCIINRSSRTWDDVKDHAYKFIDQNEVGKPSIYGTTMYLSCRSSGKVFLGDVSDIQSPKLQREINTKGNPGLVIENTKYFLIPDGYGGLLIYEK